MDSDKWICILLIVWVVMANIDDVIIAAKEECVQEVVDGTE